MRSKFTNICNNPRFSLWPWGTTGFTGLASATNFGKSAARWFFQTTAAGGDTATISKGTNSSTTVYDKWLRGEPNMTITVSALATNSTMKVRQLLEGYNVFGQNFIAMTLIVSGPAGESFSFGVADKSAKVETLGNDDNGDPILVTKTVVFPVDDTVYSYLRVTPFESPSAAGTYRLHFIQCEVLMDISKISDIEVRTDWEEWDLITRYITPIKTGMLGTASSTSQLRIPVTAPYGGWKQVPTVPTQGRVTSNVKANSNADGTEITAATPTYAIDTSLPATVNGCVVLIGGFSGATSKDPYVLGNNSTPICYLDSDYY